MWTTVLLVVHLMIALALIGLVLLQRSEGGALGIGGGGGGGGFLTGRGTANLLTRATAALALAFFLTSMGLTVLANRQLPAGSVFDRVGTPAPAAPGTDGKATPASAPKPATPAQPSGGVLDALKEGRGFDKFRPDALPAAPAPAPALPAPPVAPAPAK